MFCWLFRLMISHAADSGKRIDPVTHRHVRGCAGCRQFHRSCRVLGEALHSEAAGLSPASRQRTWKILEHLPQARRPYARPLWTAAAAAACLAVAVLVQFTSRPAQPPMSPSLPPYAITASPVELTGVWTRVFEAPLQTEARNLSNDARSGIRFLVACLTVASPGDLPAMQTDESGPPPVQ